MDPPAVGSWLRGKYRLDRVLGAGGMATVYAARHRNKKKVAIKILRTDFSSVDVIRRFVREGYVANTVEHAGVVSVLDDDVAESGHPFLVMELLEGESLEQVAQRLGGRLEADEVLAIAHQLLDVLAAAHSRSVIHRDIKPANIFLVTSGQVKVLDFGIARLREEQGNASETSTGRTLGTPAFMAPEQARGKTSLIGPQTDLWAVGATMFTLLTGKTVHEGETLQELVFNTAAKPARPVSALLPGAPPELSAIVDRALAFLPDERWASAGEMRDAVASAHRALFGTMIGREPIERLLVGRVVVPASNPDVGVCSEEDSSGPTLDVSDSARALTMLGLSATHSNVTAPPPSRRRALSLVVAAALAVGVAATATVVGVRGLSGAPRGASALGASADTPPPSSPLPLPPVEEVASAPAASATAPAAAASTPLVSTPLVRAPRGVQPSPAPRPHSPPPKTVTTTPKTASDWDRQ